MTFMLATAVALLFLIFAVFIYQLQLSVNQTRNVQRLQARLAGDGLQRRSKDRTKHVQASKLQVRLKSSIAALTQKLGSISRLTEQYKSKMLMAGFYKKTAAASFVLIKVSLTFVFPALYLFYTSATGGQVDLWDPLIAVASAVGFFCPDLYLKNITTKRFNEISKNWSDVLDIVVISISSGQTIDIALNEAAKNIAPMSKEVARELTVTATELGIFSPRTTAYRRLNERIPLDFVKNFTFDVIQSEKVGTPLAKALQNVAQEHRLHKQQMIEKKAASLGPKLTLPMIMFFFPIIFVVIMTPGFLKL